MSQFYDEPFLCKRRREGMDFVKLAPSRRVPLYCDMDFRWKEDEFWGFDQVATMLSKLQSTLVW